MDKAVMQRTIATIRLFEQMNNVITQAGGSAFSWEALMKMPVAELLSLLAPNSIEFVYTAGAKRSERKEVIRICPSCGHGVPHKILYINKEHLAILQCSRCANVFEEGTV